MRSTKSSDRTLSLFSADNDARRESGSGHSSASPWAWASSAYSPWVGRPLAGGYAWRCNPQSWRRYRRSRDPVPSTYWYSDPVALSVGIESQPEREGIVPLPRPPPTARPALRRAEQSENRGAFRRKLRSDYP